jgi:hypothetical protein
MTGAPAGRAAGAVVGAPAVAGLMGVSVGCTGTSGCGEEACPHDGHSGADPSSTDPHQRHVNCGTAAADPTPSLTTAQSQAFAPHGPKQPKKGVRQRRDSCAGACRRHHEAQFVNRFR